jgi:hypothetical protein
MFDTSPDGLRQLIAQGEGPRIEFKRRFTADRLIARHVVAFANSLGGFIFFGVGDKGELLGLSREEADYTLARLTRLAGSVLPASSYQFGTAELEGKIIVYMSVEEAPASAQPIRLATGDAFLIRDGAVVKFASAEVASTSSRRLKVFVAMSFRDEEEAALIDYFQAMKRAADSTGLHIEMIRVDLVEGDYEISQRIMDEIDASDIVLADFTLSPANVYFELGYARGRKRRIIQTARKGTHLEFDARNWRTIFYRNATELEVALKSALTDAYDEVTRNLA